MTLIHIIYNTYVHLFLYKQQSHHFGCCFGTHSKNIISTNYSNIYLLYYKRLISNRLRHTFIFDVPHNDNIHSWACIFIYHICAHERLNIHDKMLNKSGSTYDRDIFLYQNMLIEIYIHVWNFDK